MTDAQKIAEYDHLIEMIREAISLEVHRKKTGADWNQVMLVRANAFHDIVAVTLGLEALQSDQ